MMFRELAFEQIDQAPISPTLFRAAVRLLFIVAEANGQIKATKDFICSRCRVDSWGAARRMLGDLVDAKILGYRTEGTTVYLDFKAWPVRSEQTFPDAPACENGSLLRADLVAPARENGSQPAGSEPAARSDLVAPAREIGSLAETARSKSARPRADLVAPARENGSFTHTGARAGELVSELVSSDPNDQQTELTNSLTASIDKTEEARSLALLLHIRIKPVDAKRLAAGHRFETIREAVGYWWLNRESEGGKFQNTPGVVVYWLDHWERSSVPALTEAFQRTDLYVTLCRTPAELQADEEAAAEADRRLAAWAAEAELEAPADDLPDALPALDDCAEAQIWQQVLAEMALQLPRADLEVWRDTWLVSAENDEWVIGARPNALRWLEHRMEKNVQRRLASMLHRTVSVRFEGGECVRRTIRDAGAGRCAGPGQPGHRLGRDDDS